MAKARGWLKVLILALSTSPARPARRAATHATHATTAAPRGRERLRIGLRPP